MRKAWCSILAAASLCPSQSQTAQRESTPSPVAQIRAVSRMVIVPATVRSKSGSFVSGLTSRDFEIADNGITQTAIIEQTAKQPLAVALVIQTGAGSRREFQNYQTITALLGITQNAPTRRVAYVTFDSRTRQVWNFPTRLDGVQYAIDHPDTGDAGASILDAVSRAIELLQQQPPEMRRILLLLSESQDAGSTIAPLPFLHLLGESNVAVYSIVFPSGSAALRNSRYEACLGRSGSIQDATPSLQSILKRLCKDTASQIATLSGGEHIEIRDPVDLGRSIDLLSDAFANGYVLSFRPTTPVPGLHLLSLKAGNQRSRLYVSSRTIYWAR